jgi:hypothetical protein
MDDDDLRALIGHNNPHSIDLMNDLLASTMLTAAAIVEVMAAAETEQDEAQKRTESAQFAAFKGDCMLIYMWNNGKKDEVLRSLTPKWRELLTVGGRQRALTVDFLIKANPQLKTSQQRTMVRKNVPYVLEMEWPNQMALQHYLLGLKGMNTVIDERTKAEKAMADALQAQKDEEEARKKKAWQEANAARTKLAEIEAEPMLALPAPNVSDDDLLRAEIELICERNPVGDFTSTLLDRHGPAWVNGVAVSILIPTDTAVTGLRSGKLVGITGNSVMLGIMLTYALHNFGVSDDQIEERAIHLARQTAAEQEQAEKTHNAQVKQIRDELSAETDQGEGV